MWRHAGLQTKRDLIHDFQGLQRRRGHCGRLLGRDRESLLVIARGQRWEYRIRSGTNIQHWVNDEPRVLETVVYCTVFNRCTWWIPQRSWRLTRGNSIFGVCLLEASGSKRERAARCTRSLRTNARGVAPGRFHLRRNRIFGGAGKRLRRSNTLVSRAWVCKSV